MYRNFDVTFVIQSQNFLTYVIQCKRHVNPLPYIYDSTFPVAMMICLSPSLPAQVGRAPPPSPLPSYISRFRPPHPLLALSPRTGLVCKQSGTETGACRPPLSSA